MDEEEEEEESEQEEDDEEDEEDEDEEEDEDDDDGVVKKDKKDKVKELRMIEQEIALAKAHLANLGKAAIGDKSNSESTSKQGLKATKSKEEPRFKLGKNRFVTITKFGTKKGQPPKVDLREFYEKDGTLLPGKKGISLQIEEWEALQRLIHQINQVISANS